MRKGSFTIELALLMPFILGVFLFIFFLAYFMHDRCVIEKAYQTAALRGGQERKESLVKQEMEIAFMEVLPGRLLGKWEMEKRMLLLEKKIALSGEGEMLVREGLLTALTGMRSYFFSTECSAYRINEPLFIRSQKGQGRGYCSQKAMKKE